MFYERIVCFMCVFLLNYIISSIGRFLFHATRLLQVTYVTLFSSNISFYWFFIFLFVDVDTSIALILVPIFHIFIIATWSPNLLNS